MIGERVVLRVVLELLGADGGAEKVHQIGEDVLLGGANGARLRLGGEIGRHEDAM